LIFQASKLLKFHNFINIKSYYFHLHNKTIHMMLALTIQTINIFITILMMLTLTLPLSNRQNLVSQF